MSMVSEETQLVTFKLDDQEYALPIVNVVQVVRIVAITPMPEAPKIVSGVINVRGKVIYFGHGDPLFGDCNARLRSSLRNVRKAVSRQQLAVSRARCVSESSFPRRL